MRARNITTTSGRVYTCERGHAPAIMNQEGKVVADADACPCYLSLSLLAAAVFCVIAKLFLAIVCDACCFFSLSLLIDRNWCVCVCVCFYWLGLLLKGFFFEREEDVIFEKM